MTTAREEISSTPSPVKPFTAGEPCDWKIRISSWGTMDFHGTETEAEQRRRDKCWHEGSSGFMWRASNQTLVDKLLDLQAWFFDNEGGSPPWVQGQLRKARKAALAKARGETA